MSADAGYDRLDRTEHDGEEAHTVLQVSVDKDSSSGGGEVSPEGGESSSSVAEAEPEISESNTLRERLGILFENATPIIMTFFLSLSGSFVNLIFCGHLSTLSHHDAATTAQIFAGISLANMYANVTFRSIIIGLTGGVETLGSQNNGAGNYREVGLTLWRSVLVLSVVAVPCYVSWQYSNAFFSLMRIDPVVCEIIAAYLKIRCWEMPIGVVAESFEKYLMSIQVVTPPLYAAIHFNLSLVLCNTLFLWGNFQFGYRGLAIAWVLSAFASLCTLLAMAWRHPNVQRTLVAFDVEVLRLDKVLAFVGLGLPGMCMLLSEWWAYEVLSIFAGLLGTPEVAAQTIILSTAALVYMVPLGLGIATASLVGNALGAGKTQLAVEIAHLSYVVVNCLTVCMGVLILFFGRYFVVLFTDDESVLKVAESVMAFLSAFVVIDGSNAVCSGILRGTGKQNVGAITNVVAYYLFGLPGAWLLCFNAHWGVRGLMMGLSAGTLAQVLSLSTMIFCFRGYIFTPAIKAEGGGDKERGKEKEREKESEKEREKERKEREGRCPGPGPGAPGTAKKFVIIEEIGDDDDEWADA